MITWIGLCAGEIWQYLDRDDGEALLKDIYSGIKTPKETILMALGWFAREGYIILTGDIAQCEGEAQSPTSRKRKIIISLDSRVYSRM